MQHPSAQQGRGEVIRPSNAVCTSRRRAAGGHLGVFSLDCLLQDRSDEPPAPCAAPAPKKSGAEWRTDERATMCTPVHCLMPPPSLHPPPRFSFSFDGRVQCCCTSTALPGGAGSAKPKRSGCFLRFSSNERYRSPGPPTAPYVLQSVRGHARCILPTRR